MPEEIDVTCNVEPYEGKPGFHVCKSCGQLIKNEDVLAKNVPFCFEKLQAYSLREDVPGVRLVEQKIIKEENKETENKKIIKNNFAINMNWWNKAGSHKEDSQSVGMDNYRKEAASKKLDRPPQYKDDSTYNQLAKQETIDTRMKICESCEFYQNNVCLKCGCALSREHNFKNKLFHDDAKCPVGKW